ncbi:hypothetical protein [Sphingopyxis granuli]|uniref:hypothetical protein n=1 Tax=Sphingopyxis granuli TaxID=267128 RepID=UPI0012E871D4|nr:hypothetical protein [Sphingopyxis granuli]
MADAAIKIGRCQAIPGIHDDRQKNVITVRVIGLGCHFGIAEVGCAMVPLDINEKTGMSAERYGREACSNLL